MFRFEALQYMTHFVLYTNKLHTTFANVPSKQRRKIVAANTTEKSIGAFLET